MLTRDLKIEFIVWRESPIPYPEKRRIPERVHWTRLQVRDLDNIAGHTYTNEVVAFGFRGVMLGEPPSDDTLKKLGQIPAMRDYMERGKKAGHSNYMRDVGLLDVIRRSDNESRIKGMGARDS